MQSVSSRIWTRVAVFISYDNNHHTTGTTWKVYLFIYLFIYITSLIWNDVKESWYQVLEVIKRKKKFVNYESVLSTKKLKILGYEVKNSEKRPDPDWLRLWLNLPFPSNCNSLQQVIVHFTYHLQGICKFPTKIRLLSTKNRYTRVFYLSYRYSYSFLGWIRCCCRHDLDSERGISCCLKNTSRFRKTPCCSWKKPERA